MKELLNRFENKAPEIVFEWHDAETPAKGWVVINGSADADLTAIGENAGEAVTGTANTSLGFAAGDDVSGVLVTSVTPDSTAAEKQLTPGDVLLEVNQQEVKSPKDVVAKVDEARKANKKSVLLLVQGQGGDSHFVALPVDGKSKG